MVYRSLQLTDFTLASVGRDNLRSSASRQFAVPRTRLSTICDRAFPVADATVWNSLPDDVSSSITIHIYRARLKTYMFRYSFPGAIVQIAATLFSFTQFLCVIVSMKFN
jgi:hypothetical protein